MLSSVGFELLKRKLIYVGKKTAIITGASGGICAGLVGRLDPAPQSDSRVAGLPPLGIRNSRACLNWRKRATFRSDGRAGLESVVPA